MVSQILYLADVGNSYKTDHKSGRVHKIKRSQSKKVQGSWVQNLKRNVMRVFGAGPVFSENPWTSMWGWRQPHGWTSGTDDGSPTWRDHGFDRWREPNSQTFAVREIPVQYENRHSFQEPVDLEDYDMSDDDAWESDVCCCSDLEDQNNNGSRIRKRRRDSSVNAALISSKDSLLREVIEIDPEPKKSGAKTNKPSHAEKCPTLPEPPSKTARRGKSDDSPKAAESIRPRSPNNHFEPDINDTDGYSVYDYLKSVLRSTNRQIDGIKGDGNCFFRALSKVVYGTQRFYDEMRQSVVQVLEKHPKSFSQFTDGPMKPHIKTMKEDRTWATQTEIYAAATLLNKDIYILSPNQRDETYRWLRFSPQFHYVSSIPSCPCYITLCHTHGNHYDRIASLDARCNCDLDPPEMAGLRDSVDLTGDDEIV